MARKSVCSQRYFNTTANYASRIAKRAEFRSSDSSKCVLETASRHVWVRPRRTNLDFAQVLRDLVDDVYPDADQIVLVVDNLNTHHPACLYERFDPAEARRIAAKIEWHHTPEHGSWLNIAECELSVLRRQCLKRRLPTIETVEQEAMAWQERRNQGQVTVDWRCTADDARIKLKRLCPIVNVQESA